MAIECTDINEYQKCRHQYVEFAKDICKDKADDLVKYLER
jgi:hypothetical protein